MAVAIGGYAVVVKQECIESLLAANLVSPPNSTALADDSLWVCSFMTTEDAIDFARHLGDLGLNVHEGPNPDAVLVSEFDLSVVPECEWFKLGRIAKAVIGWKAGTDPQNVTAGPGWDPRVGSGLVYQDPSKMDRLQFLRYEGGVAVYFHKDLGKEVYIGRTQPPIESMYKAAGEVMLANVVNAGAAPVSGMAAQRVSGAVDTMAQVIAVGPESWGALFLYGKGCLALGKNEEAYTAYKRAFELEQGDENVPRKQAGACLLLQKYEEAVTASEKAAALKPNSAAVLGNLGLCYLMAGRVGAAKATIAAALKLDQGDRINTHLDRVIQEVADGIIEQPATLRDVARLRRRKPFWKLW